MGKGHGPSWSDEVDMNMLADDEWIMQYNLRNHGKFQEKIDAAEWLREYAYKRIHDTKEPTDKDEPEKT